MVVTVEKTGGLAIGAIVAALVSFLLTFTGHQLFGLICGVLSIPLGVVGLVMAASPRVSGGMLSIAAIVLGAIAIGVAVLGGIGAIVF